MINSPEGPDKRESAEKPTVFPRILLCALGMRDYLAVKVRYRLGSRNC